MKLRETLLGVRDGAVVVLAWVIAIAVVGVFVAMSTRLIEGGWRFAGWMLGLE